MLPVRLVGLFRVADLETEGPALPLTSRVSLGKALHLSESPFTSGYAGKAPTSPPSAGRLACDGALSGRQLTGAGGMVGTVLPSLVSSVTLGK